MAAATRKLQITRYPRKRILDGSAQAIHGAFQKGLSRG